MRRSLVLLLLLGCGNPRLAPPGPDAGKDASAGEVDAGEVGPTPDATPGGTCSGTSSLVVAGASYAGEASLARSGSGLVMAFVQYEAGGAGGVDVAWLDDHFAVAGTIGVIAPGGATPRIAWSGSELGVVYAESRTAPKIYFERLDAQGHLIPGSNTLLASAVAGGSVTSPALAWSPTAREWAIAWSKSDADPLHKHVEIARLDARGHTLPLAPLVSLPSPPWWTGDSVPYTGTSPLIWDGASFVLVHQDDTRIIVTTLPPTGGSPRSWSIPAPSSIEQGAQIVWTGATYALAWSQNDPNTIPNRTIEFVLADATGPTPGTRASLATPAGVYLAPSLAWTGSNFAVAYEVGMDVGGVWDSNIGVATFDDHGTRTSQCLVPESEPGSFLDQHFPVLDSSAHGLAVLHVAYDPDTLTNDIRVQALTQ